ncbi:unnamed protein product [Prorocentrum cordatum]|uniref:Uncharacterized protein n=1 Tax=Prorocentrum cordatum TaxID=2364126 RepID=A0ABN9VDI2_9DINO|nr:unnamed protein product [Polarella glacialis]
MPPDGSEYSNSRVYCTQGKYQLPGTKIKTCQPELSRCYGWPAECDDPFCRNGGADRGDGLYCHRGMIVSCTGDDAPVTENACSDGRTTLSQDCTRVQERHCVQRGDQFFCADGDSRLEGACNDWDNNFTPRRRRGWNYYDDNDAQRRRGSSPRRRGSPSKYYYGD